MKKILFLLAISALICSCGSYNSINSFYNTHKNDANVTAFRVPHFMFNLLRGSSTDVNSFINNVTDIRFIQLSPKSDAESTLISNQINNLVSNRFLEIYRKNEDTKRTLISIRENRDVVKEIIIYKNGKRNNSVFYFQGNFDPTKIRKLVKEKKFDNLSNTVLQQFNYSPTTPKD